MVSRPARTKSLQFDLLSVLPKAHYACDCWDAEILTSAGWTECVGCADRSAYDLAAHGRRTGKALVVREPLEHPQTIGEWQVEIDKKKFGPFYRKDGDPIERYVFGVLSPKPLSGDPSSAPAVGN